MSSNNDHNFHIKPLGDSALIIQLDRTISSMTHNKVISLIKLIEKNPFDGLVEVVAGYNNVTIHYNPVIVRKSKIGKLSISSFEKVSAYIEKCLTKIDNQFVQNKRRIEIPVLYGGAYGPDLEYVARYNDHTPESIVKLHSEKEYLVYMIGFTPGFPYLGEINQQISTPRKAQPRSNIAAGSVGIAGEQTGIYSIDSPGGWQVIGKTPLQLFKPQSKQPTLLQSGDIIRFVPINEDEFNLIKEQEQ